MAAEDADFDTPDTGDTDTSPALDTGADTTTSKIEDALQTVNDAMIYGRQKHGLPTGEEDPAVPTQVAGDVVQGPWTAQGRYDQMDRAPTTPQPGQAEPRPPIPIDTPLNNQWKGAMKPLQRTSANIPTQPAGPGGDQPNPNPFPVKNPAIPFGRRLSANIPTRPAGPGGDQPNPNPFPIKNPAIPFGRRRVADNGVIPSYAGGGPIHLADGGPPDQPSPDDPTIGNTLDAGGLPVDGASATADADASGLPVDDTAPAAGAPPAAGNAPVGDQGFDAQSVQNDPVYAFLSGAGKTSKELFEKYRSKAAEQNPDATPAELNALAIHNMPNQKMQWGGAQYLRTEADHEANTTRKLLTNPDGDKIDGDKVAEGLTKQLNSVPTGETVTAKYAENGLYQLTVQPPGNGPPKTYTLNQDQVHDLTNIGKAGQFDTLFEKTIGATLQALSQSPGTPLPQKKKPDEDPFVTYNGIKGIYKQSDVARLNARNQNQFGVQLQGDPKANVEALDAMRKERVDRETEIEKANAGLEGRKEVAKIASGDRRYAVDSANQRAAAHQNTLLDIAIRNAASREEINALTNLRSTLSSYTAAGKAVPADVQQAADLATARVTKMLENSGDSGEAAPTATGTAPPAGGQAAAPAPANRGINPTTGAPALGKFRPGQTVYDKQGKPHIVQ